MKIRFATPADVPALAELGRKFHALTRFAAYDYNQDRVAQQLYATIETGQKRNNTHCFFVAEDSQGQPVGALIGCVEQHFFSEQLVASIIHYDVLPERRMTGAGLRLLTAFRKWAENRGAVELNAGVNSGVHLERTDRFLRKLGFRQTGGNYSLPLTTKNAPEK
jgi:N-acetylglutamate synthase-like GNAT family acetyltransferase